MSSLLYKRHSIIYGATLDRFTGKYAPTGQIVWHMPKGKHGTHSFTMSELFSTAEEAKAVALEEAICWAAERLRRLGVELPVALPNAHKIVTGGFETVGYPWRPQANNPSQHVGVLT